MASLKTDICIIGATLEGLTAAVALSKRGFDVLVIEKSDRIGGALHPTQTPLGLLSKQFSFWPDSPSSELAINFVGQLLEKEFVFSKETLAPQTFHKGQFQTFVGFGENAPEYVDEISYYLSDSRLIMQESASSLLEQLQHKFEGKILFGNSVNKILTNEDTVTSIELEDGRSVEAKGFLFSEDVRKLFSLVPTEEYTQREIQRVNKTTLWNTVALDIIHGAPVTDQKNIFILSGNVKESIPCLGSFDATFEAQGRALQSSHWLAFVSTEAEDEEVSANSLREIKKQIKRAFPTALENVVFEKITLHPHSHGKLPLKQNAQSFWPGLTNLWVNSAHLNPQPNTVGSLCQSALVVESVTSRFAPEKTANPVAHPQA